MKKHSLFRTLVACKVCGISNRQLGYWIDRQVVEPSFCVYTPRGAKPTYLFSMDDMARIMLVRDLRGAGISLQKIRAAFARCKMYESPPISGEWLISNGRDLYMRTTDPDKFECLTGPAQGQFVFGFAIGHSRNLVRKRLEKFGFRPFTSKHKLIPWDQKSGSSAPSL